MAEEKKKKFERKIVEPVVMPNAPTIKSPHKEVSLAIYYPAGQRILKKKGYDEFNFENYMKVFGDDLNDNDKEILNSSDKTRIRDNMINNAGMQSFLTILYYLLLIVLVGSGYNLYNTVNTSLSIENNFGNILISLIIFLVIFYITWRVKKEEIRVSKTAEGSRKRLEQ